MSEIKFNCPACGSELTVSANCTHNCNPQSSAVQIDVHIPGSRSGRANAKIEALRAAGVDVSNLFSMQGVDGSDILVRRHDDCLFERVADDDPVIIAIMAGKTIPNRRLFRRWVMAQMFHMLTQTDYRSTRPIGFTEALNRKGYKYSWEMVTEEFRVQAKLYQNDTENFVERNRWFNQEVAVKMANHYISQLKKHISTLQYRKCKGMPYVCLNKRNIFVADIANKIFRPLELACDAIVKARNPKELYKTVANFYALIKKTWLQFDTPQCSEFKDAYKGSGAFYTLKNLILFHGCVFPRVSTDKSMDILYSLTNDEKLEGFKMLGVLKEFLVSNNINIAAKMAEWRK